MSTQERGRFPERVGLGEVLEGEPPPSGWVRECRTCGRLGGADAAPRVA